MNSPVGGHYIGAGITLGPAVSFGYLTAMALAKRDPSRTTLAGESISRAAQNIGESRPAGARLAEQFVRRLRNQFPLVACTVQVDCARLPLSLRASNRRRAVRGTARDLV